ncbi:MAG: hypothetical protein ACYC4R_09075 [Anaerolineae bacterium]
MLKSLFSFDGVNWWVLVGGLGFNFIISLLTSGIGAFLATGETSSALYQAYGMPVMMLAIFLSAGLAGFVIAKIATEYPLKHAVLSSLGSAVPFLAVAILSVQPLLLLVAIISVLGAFNGGVLAQRRQHYNPPRH